MEQVLIYGTGGYYQNKKASLNGKYEIIAFIDGKKEHGKFEDKDLIKKEEIWDKYPLFDFILIMSNAFVEIANELFEMGISGEKIKFGQNILPLNSFEQKLFGKDGTVQMNSQGEINYIRFGETQENNLIFYFRSVSELANLKAIFCDKEYNLSLNSNKEGIVIDVGMNIGAASIFFASQKWVKKVYSFEPFRETYDIAKKNIESNPILAYKIESYNFGLGKIEEQLTILYNKDMSCGMSTDKVHNDLSIQQYIEWVNMDIGKSYEEQVRVKNIADVLLPIFTEDTNTILKLDCEGSEYGILEELSDRKLLIRIDIIILEWHDDGAEKIEKILKDNNFTFFSFQSETDKGMIYAFKCK